MERKLSAFDSPYRPRQGEGPACLLTTTGIATLRLNYWSALLISAMLAAALCACDGVPHSTLGPPVKLAITTGTSSIQSGDFIQLSAVAVDASGNQTGTVLGSITWNSSDATVAKVRADGLMLSLGPGSAMISASAANLNGSLPVTVNPSQGAPGSVSFSFGPEEVVFAHATDACEPLDVPDVPARAIRLLDGTLELIDGDAPHTYASFGADFSTLKRSCNPIYVSDDNTDPATFDNQEWIHTTYREGSVIHALIHNEYHDPFAADCDPGVTSPSNPCWYNSITYATSVDGGLSFTHVAPPGHVVAPAATVWNPAGPPSPYGYFEPSNIVQSTDGFYYAVFMAIPQGSKTTSICAMRTQTLADPTTWRAWDGTGFNLQMNDPYLGSATFCTIVGSPSPDIYEGLTYNTYLQKYLLTGGGAYFTLSTDLINWNVEQSMGLPESHPVAYATIIDHDDTTPNFENTGRTPYLYFTRFNGTTISNAGINRDLVRVPVIITAH
jgi:hypothetical protein